jgi:hypothetical protein
MNSAIQIHQEPTSFASELPAVLALAKALINGGGFLPTWIKSEGEVVAVVLAGRELGMPPMASIRGIRLIQGQVVLDAALQLGLMIRAGITHKWLEDGRAGRAVLEVKRSGQEPYTSTFELADAERAGLVKPGSNWAKWPAAMLRARAVSGAGKAYAPDILAGVYAPGELDEEPALEVASDRPKTLQLSESTPALTMVPLVEEMRALMEEKLPAATTLEQFGAVARELLELHGPVRGTSEWRTFADRCADYEIPPRDAVELGKKEAAK